MRYRKIVVGVGAAGLIAGAGFLPRAYASGQAEAGLQYSLIREVVAKSAGSVRDAWKKLSRDTNLATRVLNSDGSSNTLATLPKKSEKESTEGIKKIGYETTYHTHEGEMTEPQNRRGPPQNA